MCQKNVTKTCQKNYFHWSGSLTEKQKKRCEWIFSDLDKLPSAQSVVSRLVGETLKESIWTCKDTRGERKRKGWKEELRESKEGWEAKGRVRFISCTLWVLMMVFHRVTLSSGCKLPQGRRTIGLHALHYCVCVCVCAWLVRDLVTNSPRGLQLHFTSEWGGTKNPDSISFGVLWSLITVTFQPFFYSFWYSARAAQRLCGYNCHLTGREANICREFAWIFQFQRPASQIRWTWEYVNFPQVWMAEWPNSHKESWDLFTVITQVFIEFHNHSSYKL